jgi:hypothetical protein
LPLRPAPLPLGADIGPRSVSLVRVEVSPRGLAVRASATQSVAPVSEDQVDLAIAQTIRRALSELGTRERRCVLAAPASEVVHRTFRVPPGMRRREAERSATLEADALAPWTAAERIVALDDIPGREDEKLLTVARESAVTRLVSIARAGGLRPVAVDLPACAWRRAVPDADAVLDHSDERAQLVIFGDTIGSIHGFPARASDERLATLVRTALVEARREGLADVRRLSLLGAADRYEALASSLSGDGYAIAPVTCATVPAPTWAFAYGLATWPVTSLGVRVS